jgi:hypothetical protein
MRGPDTFTGGLFTMRRLDDFDPADHPLQRIRVMVNEALAKMDELFSQMYEADVKGGRQSVAPEKLLRAMLLQILFGIRSERQLMEQTFGGRHISQGRQHRALTVPPSPVQEAAAGADRRRLRGAAAWDHRVRQRVGRPARIASDITRKGVVYCALALDACIGFRQKNNGG